MHTLTIDVSHRKKKNAREFQSEELCTPFAFFFLVNYESRGIVIAKAMNTNRLNNLTLQRSLLIDPRLSRCGMFCNFESMIVRRAITMHVIVT